MMDTPAESRQQPVEPILIATVASVAADGATLIFAGEAEAGAKKYRGNVSADIRAGDLVLLTKDSDTYIIDYTIGAPGSRLPSAVHGIPAGGADGQWLLKDGDADYEVKWGTPAIANGIPTGGETGQVLAKCTSATYDVEWVDQAQGVPSGGTTGQVLTKTSSVSFAVRWADPAGGAPDRLTNGIYNLVLSGATLMPSYPTTMGSYAKSFIGYFSKIYLGSSYPNCYLECKANGKLYVNGIAIN